MKSRSEGNKAHGTHRGPAQAGGTGGAGAQAEGQSTQGSLPPGRPKEMGRESLTCYAGPLGLDAWVPL